MRPRRTLAALLAAPCLVSACGGGGSSVADPPVSSTPTSSAPATQPPAHEGPRHFIRRWADAEKRMENTGKTDAYLAMGRGCTSCRQLAADVSHFYAAGGYVKWGGWRILSIRVNSHAGQVTRYAVRNRSLPTTYRESASGSPKHLAGGITTELLSVSKLGNHLNVRSKAELAS